MVRIPEVTNQFIVYVLMGTIVIRHQPISNREPACAEHAPVCAQSSVRRPLKNPSLHKVVVLLERTLVLTRRFIVFVQRNTTAIRHPIASSKDTACAKYAPVYAQSSAQKHLNSLSSRKVVVSLEHTWAPIMRFIVFVPMGMIVIHHLATSNKEEGCASSAQVNVQ